MTQHTELFIATDGWGDEGLWRRSGADDPRPEFLFYRFLHEDAWQLIKEGLNVVRHHGFSYKRCNEVKAGDFIVIKTKPMGEATHILMVEDARRVRSIERRAGDSYRFNFPDFTMGGFYDSEETALVPVVDGTRDE